MQTISDKQPHVLIRVSLRMSYINEHSVIIICIRDSVLKMRYAVNLPFLRWNRYKLAMNDVSAAINQKKGCTKTNPQRTDDTLYFEIFDF